MGSALCVGKSGLKRRCHVGPIAPPSRPLGASEPNPGNVWVPVGLGQTLEEWSGSPLSTPWAQGGTESPWVDLESAQWPGDPVSGGQRAKAAPREIPALPAGPDFPGRKPTPQVTAREQRPPTTGTKQAGCGAPARLSPRDSSLRAPPPPARLGVLSKAVAHGGSSRARSRRRWCWFDSPSPRVTLNCFTSPACHSQSSCSRIPQSYSEGQEGEVTEGPGAQQPQHPVVAGPPACSPGPWGPCFPCLL